MEVPVLKELSSSFNKAQFGDSFRWGVSTSAYQIEGAHNLHGKGASIWDTFSQRRKAISSGHTGEHACDFYKRFESDLSLMRWLNIPNFRFSISWPRVLPFGTGIVNHVGVDFYDRLIDNCLARGIEPWVTLYHWDLPQALEDSGGWTNRDIVRAFSEYVEVCAHYFGDRVEHWMLLNEPMVFTGAGYFLGIHAPGRKGLSQFIPAMHHALLSQSAGARILRSARPGASIGTTFSCSHIEAYSDREKDVLAARRVDALLNRLFLEPTLGLGYPMEELGSLRQVERFVKSDDERDLPFEFDFIGVQNYTQEVVKHSYWTPVINASIMPANKRNVPHTVMNWEINPPSIYRVLKKFGSYPGVKSLVVTENGAAFHDKLENGKVNDLERLIYIRDHIGQVLRAKQEGVPVDGYFVWTLMDNFEWAEGYHPRFGIVYTDFNTQQRIIKASGKWYREFLAS